MNDVITIIGNVVCKETRKHSSSMRTIRCSDRWGRGVLPIMNELCTEVAGRCFYTCLSVILLTAGSLYDVTSCLTPWSHIPRGGVTVFGPMFLSGDRDPIPWTETPLLDRDPIPLTETPLLDRDPPGQRPHPLDRD